MTYIIAEPCIDTKDTACVDVCPVDCIHPTKNETAEFEKEKQLYIDPEECIDCGACEPVCPVEAIFEEAATPDRWKQFIQINVELARAWPSITKTKDPLPEAEEWKDVKDKLDQLVR